MIDFKVININEVWDSIKDTDLILNLLHDEIEINDIYIYLKDNTIYNLIK
jgi:Zn-finger domain-containing protein